MTERQEMLRVIDELVRCLTYVVNGETARPPKWQIPCGSIRDQALQKARILLMRSHTARTKAGRSSALSIAVVNKH